MMHGHPCVLVTGGCGAIGACVLNRWIQQNPKTRFVNVDLLTYAADANNIHPAPNYHLEVADICDAERIMDILRRERPTAIVHLAAETHVDQSFCNSLKFTRTNVLGTHTLLECAHVYRRAGGDLRLFLHMSTDEVYGSVPEGEVCHESSLFAPTNPYAATKAGAEMLCKAYVKSFQLPVVVARCNNAISPFQHVEKLVPQCIACFRERRPLQVHGNGQAKRSFVYGDDIADALEILLHQGAPGGIYNIGNPEEITVLDMAALIHRRMRVDAPLEELLVFVPDRAFQDLRYAMDVSALSQLGWRPRVSLEAAIDACVAARLKDTTE